MNIETLHADPCLRAVKAGHVLFALWSAVPEITQVAALEKASERHRDSIGGTGQIMVNVIFDGVPNFGDDVRAELARFSKRAVAWRAAVAHVVLLSGFRGVAVRSFMSTLLLVSRSPVPSKVCNSIEGATRWLAPLLPKDQGWSEQRFREAFEQASAS